MKTNKKSKLEINKKVISKLQIEQIIGGGQQETDDSVCDAIRKTKLAKRTKHCNA